MNSPGTTRMAALRLPALAVLLVGCTAAQAPPLPPACPKVGFLYGLHALDTLSIEGQSLPVEVELAGLNGVCSYAGNRLELDYSFELRVRPTAPLNRETLSVPYFIAVLDDQGQVLAKERFVAEVRIGKPGDRRGVRERLQQTLVDVAGRSASAFRIVIGFDLPADDALARWEAREL